jgi:hypothetical protein
MNKAHGPSQPNDLHDPSNGCHQPPSREPPLRSRVVRHTTNFRPTRGPSTPEWISASLEGPVPLERVSASLEAFPRPAVPHMPPTATLNALARRGCPGQRVNPRHHRSPNTAWELGPGVVLTTCHCATIPGTMRMLCGVADVIPQHCATRSRPSSTPRPSKRDGNTLEEHTAADLTLTQDDVVTRGTQSMIPPSPPALCGHPQPCATILGIMEPSSALWSSTPIGHRHAGPCTAQAPPVSTTLKLMYER